MVYFEDNIYNVHKKERAEGNPVVEITRMFHCSISFVVSRQHKCKSQNSLTETIRKESFQMVLLSYRQNCHMLDLCTNYVWVGKDLHVHPYFDLLPTHNADHYFISIQMMAL